MCRHGDRRRRVAALTAHSVTEIQRPHVAGHRDAGGQFVVGRIVDADQGESTRRCGREVAGTRRSREKRCGPRRFATTLPTAKQGADKGAHHRPAESVSAHMGGEQIAGDRPPNRCRSRMVVAPGRWRQKAAKSCKAEQHSGGGGHRVHHPAPDATGRRTGTTAGRRRERRWKADT